MKSIAQLCPLFLIVTSALADMVSYDTAYDNPASSLGNVACSDGPNGLLATYSTLGLLPSFPNIGGARAVAGYDSPNCGSCWHLSFGGNSVNVLAIDQAASGFNIALEAMNTLTGGEAVALGRVDAVATQVDPSICGL